MAEPKFSPGPWRWTNDKYLAGEGGQLLIRASFMTNDVDMLLIAAAPDLYAALDDLLDYRGGAESALEDDHVVDRAKAALAKARGES